ncbi:MAG TPA: hypothetical protein VIR29_01560 [Anseongella sp.]
MPGLLISCQPRGGNKGPVYTTANAHSQDDYEQKNPFFLAFDGGVDYINTDQVQALSALLEKSF